MSWHYLQGLEEESLEVCCEGGEPLPPLKSKTTQEGFFCNGKLTASYLDSLSGTMCEPSMEQNGKGKLTLLPEGSPAKIFHAPEKELELTASEAVCGEKWRESLVKFDLDTFSWKNSPMLVGRGLARVVGDLAKMGFNSKWGIVGAHHVAAPHKRDRVWIMANTEKLQRDGSKDNARKLPQSKAASQSRNNGWEGDVANTFSKRLERFSRDGEKLNKSGRDKTKPVRPTTSTDLSRKPNWWSSEPKLGRVANGVACRVDRLKAIGNGQVPAVAALAWDILSKGNHALE
jgi:hypothetical protein